MGQKEKKVRAAICHVCENFTSVLCAVCLILQMLQRYTALLLDLVLNCSNSRSCTPTYFAVISSVIKSNSIASPLKVLQWLSARDKSLRISPPGCLRADKQRFMETRPSHNSDMKLLSLCFHWMLFKIEHRGQIMPNALKEKWAQLWNHSQRKRGIPLYKKTNMKRPQELGVRQQVNILD